MVHADAIVGEISCQQKFFLTIFFRVKLKFSCYWWLVVNQHLRKGLDDFEDLENVCETVAEISESSKERKCCQWKQHVHVRVLPV